MHTSLREDSNISAKPATIKDFSANNIHITTGTLHRYSSTYLNAYLLHSTLHSNKNPSYLTLPKLYKGTKHPPNARKHLLPYNIVCDDKK